MKRIEVNINTSSFLDMARWISSWVVFLGHLRNHIFVPYNEFVYTNFIIKVFVFFSLFGRCAVIIFFVISGYLIGGPLLEGVLTQRINNFSFLKEYYISRFTRLYVVLIPGLLLTFLLMSMKHYISYGIDEAIYSNTYSISAFLINLSFLQTILGPTYGNNYPLWSLANEFWYYMIFPLLIILYAANMYKKKIASAIMLSFICKLLWGHSILLYFLIWMIGAIVYVVKFRVTRLSISIPMFVILACISRVCYSGGYFPVDFLMGIGFALLLNSIQYYSQNIKLLYSTKQFNKEIADFSYTLYITHFPFIVFYASFFLEKFNNSFQPNSIIAWKIYFVVGLLTAISAWILSKFTENKTHYIKKILVNILNNERKEFNEKN